MKVQPRNGFTYIETLFVGAIFLFLAAIVYSGVNSTALKTRDYKRVQHMKLAEFALDNYYKRFGTFPAAASDMAQFACKGWDTSADGMFINELQGQALWKPVQDPLNILPRCGNYVYYRYNAGAQGCDPNKGAFYVLGVADMENADGAHSTSPGFSCSMRDWQTEFEWVTGKFENE